jgi:hypothetical protein
MFEEDFKVRPSVNDLIEKVDSTIAENATAGVGG